MPTTEQLRAVIQVRATKLAAFYPAPRCRGPIERYATASTFADQVIADASANGGVVVDDGEVASFLVPLLSRQGLVDITRPVDVRTDANVHNWLAGQGWTVDHLVDTGRSLLAWVKFAIRDASVTVNDVRDYIERNPNLRRVPARVSLAITQLELPSGAARSRGAVQTQWLAPALATTRRSVAEGTERHVSAQWDELRLFLDLVHVDSALRGELEGKRVGDAFGPLQLDNGCVAAGTVAAILPEVDLAGSVELWQFAAVLARLDKVNQKQTFEQLANRYFEGLPHEARGLWGDILGIGGAIVGGIFGVPEIGGAVGGLVGGWIDGQSSGPSPAPRPPTPQIPSQVMNPGFNPYCQPGLPPAIPPFFQGGFSTPALPMVPSMPPGYAGLWSSWLNNMPSMPTPWLPPFWCPMPIRVF